MNVMKPKHIAASFLGMIVGLAVLVSFHANQPVESKKQDKIYVLPLVEDMPSAPNPLQF